MSTLDLDQQERLDQVKQFWKQHGNLITWTLVAVLGAYAAWTGYLYWQQKSSQGATGLYDELDKAVSERNVDRVRQAFGDLKAQYAGTTAAEQGALLAAKVQADEGKVDESRAALQWLVDHGKNEGLVAVARLRLAGLQLDAKQFDEALKTLSSKVPDEYAALVADRRGDVFLAQGKNKEAIEAFQAAWKGLDSTVEYRSFIEGKLTVLGAAPQPLKTAPTSVAR
jgi:predicted negative regulator of RcsB-dependent stress response